MELSVKKLLDDYFSKEQIRDALRDIGESASGNKDRLARCLRDHWESQNPDIYELLDFTDIDSLEMICHHYKLDATFKEKDALKGRIEKGNLLVLDKKPDAFVDRNHDSFVSKTKVSSKINDSKSKSNKPQNKPKINDSKSKSNKPETTKPKHPSTTTTTNNITPTI